MQNNETVSQNEYKKNQRQFLQLNNFYLMYKPNKEEDTKIVNEKYEGKFVCR